MTKATKEENQENLWEEKSRRNTFEKILGSQYFYAPKFNRKIMWIEI